MVTITTGIHLDIGRPPFSFSVCLSAVVVDEADVTFHNIVPVEGISVERLQILYQERLLLEFIPYFLLNLHKVKISDLLLIMTFNQAHTQKSAKINLILH